MESFKQRWTRALDAVLEALQSNPQAAAEFAQTRGQFGCGVTKREELSNADRRHFEWFLLERPSDALGGTPLDVLRDVLLGGQHELGDKLFETLRSSVAGVFAITSKESGSMLWCRDLLSMGEYPVRETAAEELAVGDLLVGRLYPLDGYSELSPALGVFQDQGVASALRADLEAARASRRNTLRMTQVELEQLFFGGGATPTESADPLADLCKAGLETAQAQELLDELVQMQAMNASPNAITELLNRVAFDFDCDLGAVQRTLLVAWAANTSSAESTGDERTHVIPTPRREPTANEVVSALDAFDSARGEGGDLEQLFQNLEQSLGLDEDAPLVDNEQAPDFPGVVGAVVEEFLWETAARDGEQARTAHSSLSLFGEYASNIGVFEELAPTHAIEFFTRWLPNQTSRLAPAEWPACLSSFTTFAHWVEESHQHPFISTLEPELPSLLSTIERLQRMAPLREQLSGAERFDVLGQTETLLTVRANDGEEREFRIEFADAFIVGDRVEIELVRGGGVRVGEIWPVLRASE